MYPPEIGGNMPDNNRKKGQHLTWEDHHEIRRGLREHRIFKEIAEFIGCSPDMVSKEIRNHRYHKERKSVKRHYIKPNRCKYRDTCRRRDVCNKKKGYKCRIHCRECLKCNELCPDFVNVLYQIEKRLHMYAITVQSLKDVYLKNIFIMLTTQKGNILKNFTNSVKVWT